MEPLLAAKANYVYRITEIHVSCSYDELQQKVQGQLGSSARCLVHSLGLECVKGKTKTATVSFQGDLSHHSLLDLETLFRDQIPNAPRMTIDADFLGLTTLYSPEPVRLDTVDIVFVVGLASHPINTFRPKRESEKMFMWPRDKLPKEVENCRVMTWGYQSKVIGSSSKQTIRHIGTNLLEALQALAKKGRRPFILAGVSLGGLVIQEAIALMHENECHDLRHQIVHLFMFGVPKQGALLSTVIKQVVKDQPNAFLVHQSLDEGSAVLTELQARFNSAFPFPDSMIYSFFENLVTPEYVMTDAGLTATGAESHFVSQASATVGRNYKEAGAIQALPLQKNHFDIVRFSPGEDELKVVLRKFEDAASSAYNIFQARDLQITLPGKLREIEGHWKPPQGRDNLWLRLDVQTLALYRAICTDLSRMAPKGCVTVQTLESAFISKHGTNSTIRSAWQSLKPLDEKLSRNFLMAVVFTIHLWRLGESFPQDLPSSDQHQWDTRHQQWNRGKDVNKRYETLKRFDDWVDCCCGPECDLQWNFVNDLGVCGTKTGSQDDFPTELLNPGLQQCKVLKDQQCAASQKFVHTMGYLPNCRAWKATHKRWIENRCKKR